MIVFQKAKKKEKKDVNSQGPESNQSILFRQMSSRCGKEQCLKLKKCLQVHMQSSKFPLAMGQATVFKKMMKLFLILTRRKSPHKKKENQHVKHYIQFHIIVISLTMKYSFQKKLSLE